MGSFLFVRALRGHAEREPPTAAATNLFKNTLAAAVFVAAFAFSSDERWPAAASWPTLLSSGVCGFAIGDALYLAALPRAGVQVATMVALVHVPATVFLDWLFLRRGLPPSALAWMAVVILGVWLVVGERGPTAEHRGAAVRTGAWLAFAAAVSQSFGVVLGHQGMRGTTLYGGTLVRMLGGIGGALVAAALVGIARSSLVDECGSLTRPLRRREHFRPLATAALFGSVLGLPLFHFALRGLPSGVASVLFATTPLFTLPLGFLFGERHGPRAWLGTAIGFGGVLGLVASLA